MHHHLRWPCALALAGCFADGPPKLAAADDDGEADGSSSTTTDSLPTVTSVTGSHSSASSTTQGDDDASSLSESSTTSGDTASDSSEDTSSSEASSGSSSGEPPYEGPYGDCWDGPVQGPKSEYLCPPSPCVVADDDSERSACAPECASGCETGPDDVGTVCLDAIAVGTVPAICVIQCAGADAPCPATMECTVTSFQDAGASPVWTCMWP